MILLIITGCSEENNSWNFLPTVQIDTYEHNSQYDLPPIQIEPESSLMLRNETQMFMQDQAPCSIWLIDSEAKLYQFHCLTLQPIYISTLEIDPLDIYEMAVLDPSRGFISSKNNIYPINLISGEIEESIVHWDEDFYPIGLTFWQGDLILTSSEDKIYKVNLETSSLEELSNMSPIHFTGDSVSAQGAIPRLDCYWRSSCFFQPSEMPLWPEEWRKQGALGEVNPNTGTLSFFGSLPNLEGKRSLGFAAGSIWVFTSQRISRIHPTTGETIDSWTSRDLPTFLAAGSPEVSSGWTY